MHWPTVRISGAFTVFFLAGHLQAATVTECGTTICYTFDDAQPAIAEFGAPTLVGDSLEFSPGIFKAESMNGAGTDELGSLFIFDEIYSISGDDIERITISESGEYDINSDGEVSAEIILSVVNLAPTVPPPENGMSSALFSTTGDSGGEQVWDLTAIFDVQSEFVLPANSLAMTLENTLTAIADTEVEDAWIEKSFVLTAAAVPVPAAVWLFGSALGLIGWMRRRKA